MSSKQTKGLVLTFMTSLLIKYTVTRIIVQLTYSLSIMYIWNLLCYLSYVVGCFPIIELLFIALVLEPFQCNSLILPLTAHLS